MDTNAYRNSYLFETFEECCTSTICHSGANPEDTPANQISDLITFADEDFEAADSVEDLPWIHGGTHTHLARWHVTTHEKHAGARSMRSGDLNHERGKSSDITLKVNSISGATLSFWYLADVSHPFDYFEYRLDGTLNHKDAAPQGVWTEYVAGIAPGPHEISFHVISPNDSVSINRNVDAHGTGVVYVDDLEFKPVT